MSFVSYAQNFEDVLLWRALHHVTPGFYIDVGANDPEEHSVTRAFYDAGWHGINIEPLTAFHEMFMQQRPRDINLAVAAGANDGEISLFDVPAVNGWASSSPDVANQHRGQGYDVVERRVPLMTLNTICAAHVTGPVHFLKIDVEGFEEQVLRGLDLVRWRPWVLVIEATLPNSRETNHETWEFLVLAHRYTFAYFDGLNRYYVAEEQASLLPSLQVQVNVFDDAIRVHYDRALRENIALSAQVAALSATLAETPDLAKHFLHLAAEQLENRFASTDAAMGELWNRSLPGIEQRMDGIAGRAEEIRAEAAAEAAGVEDRLRETLADIERRLAEAESRASVRELEADAMEIHFLEHFANLQAHVEQRLLDVEIKATPTMLPETLFGSLQVRGPDRRVGPFSRRADDVDASLASTRNAIERSSNELSEARAAAQEQSEQSERMVVVAEHLQRRLDAVLTSRSWRMTAPYRVVGQAAHRLVAAVRNRRVLSGIRRRAVLAILGPGGPEANSRLRGWLRRTSSQTWARKIVMPILHRFPQLRSPLRRLAGIMPPTATPGDIMLPDWPGLLPGEYLSMSASSRKVLLDLARASQASSNS